MTLQETLDRLAENNAKSNGFYTVEELRNLAAETSADVPGAKPGAVTLLYSGQISADGLSATELAEFIGQNSDGQVRTMAQTDLGKLLSDNAFREALVKAAGSEAAAANLLNDSRTGLWAEGSGRFVDAATGDFKTITPLSSSDRVFAQVEFERALANPNCTSIDGIPKDYLVKLQESVITKGGTAAEAMEAARSAVTAASFVKSAELEVVRDADGRVQGVGTERYFADTPGVKGSALPAELPGRTSVADLMHENMSPEHLATLRQGDQALSDIGALAKLHGAADALGKVSTVLDIVDLYLTATEAHAQYQAGDTTGALLKMDEWMVKFAASYAAGAIAAQIVGSALAPLCLTGPVGAAVAGGLALLAGIGAGALAAWGAGQLFEDPKAAGGIDGGVKDKFGNAQRWQPRRDPLTFDLDGDGIETVGASATSPILFDHDGDGIKTGTGWVKADDGFLVLDRNDNGQIDNGTELFGDSTPLAAGGKAADGFAALAQEDTNNDGQVDAADARFQGLRIWRDLNQDGISQAQELLTLEGAGIATIQVAKTSNSAVQLDGNRIADLGSYTRTDGSVGTIGDVGVLADVDLTDDTFHSEFPERVPLVEGLSPLPNLKGSGQVRDLWEAASLSPTLKNLLVQFTQATSRAGQETLLDPVLEAWSETSTMATSATGAFAGHPLGIYFANVAPSSAEHNAWLRRLSILERFNGRTFLPSPADPTAPVLLSLTAGQLDLLGLSYRDLKNSLYGAAAMQTRLFGLSDSVTLQRTESGWVADFTAVNQLLEGKLASDPAEGIQDIVFLLRLTNWSKLGWDGLELLRTAVDQTKGQPGMQDVLANLGAHVVNGRYTVAAGDEILVAGDGNDIVIGDARSSTLLGGAGVDVLIGSSGDDVLDGGPGDDHLYGANQQISTSGGTIFPDTPGNDTFVFRRGDGKDSIYDYDARAGSTDTLRLVGLDPTDVTLTRRGASLLVLVNDSSDEVDLPYWGLGAEHRIERIEFADGSVLEGDALASIPFLGTDGNDSLAGSAEDDAIVGLDGNDVLQGGYGADILDGGTGDDTLYGGFPGFLDWSGAGNDTYIFGRGYGSDTIYDRDTAADNLDTIELKDLNAADVTIKRVGNTFVVAVNGSTDRLSVADWNSGKESRIERIEFADGSVLEGATLVAPYLGTAGNDTLTGTTEDDVLLGLAGNDVLQGSGGNDVLDGGTGNDTLYGGMSGYTSIAGVGDDTYVFGIGYGSDLIYDYDTTAANLDTIRLKDLNPADVTIRREGSSFVIDVNGSSDEIRVADWSQGAASRIERIEFADGSVLEGATLVAPYLGTAGNDTLTGTTEDDVLLGLAGNDVLQGSGGNDVLDGGTGNDTLYGGMSGYTSIAGVGDDTYVFGIGYGSDLIYDYDTTAANLDTIRLKDLNAADVTIRREGSNFVIGVNGSSDEIRVADWSQGAASRIERIEFADGSVLEGATLVAPYLGTAGNDTLTGTTEDDVLLGLAGNDVLQGSGGNDVLDGGTGNDTLYGGMSGYTSAAGAGDDTYIFGRGYGSDTIYDYDTTTGNTDTIELKDLNATDVTIRRDSTTFYISVNGAADQIRVADWGTGAENRVERVRFADGTVLEGAALAATPFVGTDLADTLTGTAAGDVLRGLGGNDVLSGAGGDDVLDGGAGNDTLRGGIGGYAAKSGAGNDTYLFGRGYGQDSVYDFDDTPGNLDTIRLLDLNAADVTVRRTATNFYIEVKGATEYITVNDWGSGAAYRIERVEFADGTALDAAALAAIPFIGTENNDSITGTAGSDTIFGLGGNDVLNGVDGDDTLYGGAGNDILSGVNGDDVLDGGPGDDQMTGALGNDTYYVDSPGDRVTESTTVSDIDTVIARVAFSLADNPRVENLTYTGSADLMGTGNASNNVMIGNDGANLLTGAAGDDTLRGAAGNDRLDGGTGNDGLEGGAGDDMYVFARGYGQDRANESASGGQGNDKVEFLAGVLPGEVSVSVSGTSLVLAIYATADALTLEHWYEEAARIERVVFANGTQWDWSALRAQVNRGVAVVGSPGEMVVDEDSPLSAVLGAGVFTDQDPDDRIALALTLVDGSPLPEWLSFDATSGELAGTPRNDHVGALALRLTGTDLYGASASVQFGLQVRNTNDAPVLAVPLTGRGGATEDLAFEYLLPDGVFVDEDLADTLTYTASLANGDALPRWLTVDPAMPRLAGTPANADVGILQVKVIATDEAGKSASGTFLLNVVNVNDAPVTTGALPAQIAPEGTLFQLDVPPTLFVDPDGDDSVTLAASVDGGQLPAWLSFNTHAGRFAGTPGNEDAGSWQVTLRATDITGAFASSEFLLTVPRSIGVQLTGTPQADVLSGSTGDDTIAGAGAADTLNGGGGGDTLDGGPGADRLDGGSGEDRLLFSPDATWIRPATAPSSSDTVAYARWQRLSAVNGRTRSFDLFVGGLGMDTLIGTAAADAFILDESAYEAGAAVTPRYVGVETFLAGGGDDVIDLRSVTLSYGAATLDGEDGNDTLYGNAAGNALIGGAGNDTLYGSTARDVLAGGAGNDTLDGGPGGDLLSGGLGDDTYYVDHGGDEVVELPGEGYELVYSNVSYVLAPEIERLFLSGAASIDGGGNALDNFLAGNIGNNVLRGEDGNDQLFGGGGSDVLVGGRGDDFFYVWSGTERIEEAPDQGNDLVSAWMDYRLAASVEALSLSSTAVFGGGNALANRISGSELANYLDGGDGNDVLRGYGASDVLQGGRDADSLVGDGGAARTLSVTAKGSSARGVPAHMQVRVDGIVAGEFNVDSASYQAYTVAYALDPDAAHKVDVVFTNDASYPNDSPPADRNLYVWSVRWGDTTLSPTSAGVTYDVGTGAAAFDGANVRAGQSTMAWNGALRFQFTAVTAHDLLDGGEGDDDLQGGEGNDLLVGGDGDDSLDTGGGANVVLHNAGDGADQVKLGGTRMTVSLGGGTAYEDLALRRVGSDLVLETGADEGVTLAEWYSAATAQPQTLSLQTITQAMADFDGSSADTLLNKKVQRFDFKKLVQQYDQARAGDPTLDRWALMNQLLDARLAVSDTEAMGGDLAYQYGMNGGLAGIGLGAAQQVLNAQQFGSQAQALRPLSELQQGQMRLG